MRNNAIISYRGWGGSRHKSGMKEKEYDEMSSFASPDPIWNESTLPERFEEGEGRGARALAWASKDGANWLEPARVPGTEISRQPMQVLGGEY